MKAKRVACLAVCLLAMAGLVDAQDKVPSVYVDGKVANFALPGHDYSSPGFESLSFWSGPHGKAIDYEYGADQKRVRLRAIGPDGSDEGFAVRFPNGLVLDIVPQGTALPVSDRSGDYSKTFESQYEGPVDGSRTFSTPRLEKADPIRFVGRTCINS